MQIKVILYTKKLQEKETYPFLIFLPESLNHSDVFITLNHVFLRGRSENLLHLTDEQDFDFAKLISDHLLF